MEHDASVDQTNAYLAELAHEMRSPLHSILGFSHMLADKCGETEAQAWLSNIRTASKHLLALVNDIIDVNRLNTQPVEIANERVDIRALVMDIINTLHPQTRIGQLTLNTFIDPNCAQFWRGDQRKLKQVLINILSNAIKFTPPLGNISIQLNEVGSGLRISVQDSGVGMDEETLTHLFQPYYHSNSRINQEGTGLGLTITRRLIELMHGEILISSQPNEGSEFVIILPLDKDTSVPIITPEAPAEKLHQTTHILLVDDDPLHHEVLIGMLKNQPIVVHSAFNMAQTLDICPEVKPQLILIDYRLPDGDGLTLAKTLRHCNNYSSSNHRIKLAMLTAHRGVALQEALADNTIDALLYKPLELASLVQLIAQCRPQQAATVDNTRDQRTENNEPSSLSMPNYLQSLWPEFYASLEEGINECQQLLDARNYKELSNTAHRLKGQAMIFHHHRFWQAFEGLESLAQAHNHSMAIGVINQISQTYQEERNLS